ncbi:stage II sporulation protein R [Thermohalobacter berrensis]|uniref:Stage II sporulation protein R n=1 Tax=Thermohalobacter berrensis TaxID=99594 RepID=A0A419T7J9_9FIRM|nr:stage II sporulation protein R [Thermohalobacter berrensis]
MKRVLPILALILFITSVIGYFSLKDIYENRESYKEKLIRFHVIANSDSPNDQALKRSVRDRILKKIKDKFNKVSSINESREIILNSLDDIEYIAENEVKSWGKNYDVNVYFGDYNFPTKSYGNFTLPAGKYEAVRVVIGEGKGENWWCVMFPPLCFIDVTHGITNPKVKKELKGLLTDDEYRMIVNAKQGKDVPLKLRFKVVEIIEKSKMKLANMFVSKN